MSDCLILAHSHGRYLADNLQDDSIDVVYESGADLDRLRQFVPSDVRKYKVRDSFSIFFFAIKLRFRGFANNKGAVHGVQQNIDRQKRETTFNRCVKT